MTREERIVARPMFPGSKGQGGRRKLWRSGKWRCGIARPKFPEAADWSSIDRLAPLPVFLSRQRDRIPNTTSHLAAG
jgi:hypothetical protein